MDQSVSDVISLTTSNMCPNTSQGTETKEYIVKLILPKRDNGGNFCQNRFLTPQKGKVVPAIVLQDPKKRSKVEELRKRRQVRSYINCSPKQSKILSARDVNILDEELEDINLLPSKRDDKKSEISLTLVPPKTCGCSGPCEIIICEVIVQQYLDQDKMSFLLAMNIEEEEIDAYVMKHCDNQYCDALSIDHDRCRRGSIELYRCDQSNVCDVCRTIMKDWNSRLYHKKCKNKIKYIHNNVSQERLLKDRFHLLELQISDDLRKRKKNYLDPVDGFALALETIRNNKELMIIPKMMSNKKSTLTITAMPSTASINTTQSAAINSQANGPKKIVSKTIATPSHSNATSSSSDNSAGQRTNPVQFSSAHLQQKNTYIVKPSSKTCTAVVPAQQNQYIHLPSSSSSTITTLPTTVRNFIVPQSHVVMNDSQSAQQLLGPIRVMPITTLNTAPSLLHRQQGIPKFCVMAGNVITTLTVPDIQTLQPIIAANIVAPQEQISEVPNIQTLQPIIAANIVAPQEQISEVPSIQTFQPIVAANVVVPQEQISEVPVNTPKAPAPTQKRRIFPQKRVFPKKPSKQFFCVYCGKHLSTDWYFKKHVAKHQQQKHTPRVPLSDSHGEKSYVSEKRNQMLFKKEHDHDYACDSPYTLIRTANDESETREPLVQLEYDIEYYDEDFVDEKDNCTSIDDFKEEKNIKCEKTFDTWNGNIEIFKNGIKIEAQDDDYVEDTSLQEHDIEESFNENCNAERNEFAIFSVIGNTNPENFKEKDVTALR